MPSPHQQAWRVILRRRDLVEIDRIVRQLARATSEEAVVCEVNAAYTNVSWWWTSIPRTEHRNSVYRESRALEHALSPGALPGSLASVTWRASPNQYVELTDVTLRLVWDVPAGSAGALDRTIEALDALAASRRPTWPRDLFRTPLTLVLMLPVMGLCGVAALVFGWGLPASLGWPVAAFGNAAGVALIGFVLRRLNRSPVVLLRTDWGRWRDPLGPLLPWLTLIAALATLLSSLLLWPQ